ncbi:MAG TPA: glycogen/starch/alpha-glucan phosphorylase [Thermoanaerobaculaceae bacterium]|nr:glycogen/starch/alpha-glucan phosphorylase [Thermoanaerobaculaceae bacterium]
MATSLADHTVSRQAFRDRFVNYLRYIGGLEIGEATPANQLAALQLTIRETLIDRAVATQRAHEEHEPKTVYYLSLEYLLGRLVENNLIATGLREVVAEVMAELGLDLERIVDEEPDPGLGNGGLGRLAACFLESLATLDYPALGYGLRYDFGIFRQEFSGGWQRERPDTWLKDGYGWEIARPDLTVAVGVGGAVSAWDDNGEKRASWTGARVVYGVPHDVLIAGYGTPTVSTLRLWKAEAPDEFDFDVFSKGDFLSAVEGRERAEAVTKVLYPSDEAEAGRELRLTQEYFLVACSVADVVRRFRERHGERWDTFPEKVAFQLNDTHPALTIAELMRVFVDEVGLPWEKAWSLTRASCAYTQHTVLSESLETWPVALMQRLMPRHVQIIYDINKRFLEQVGSVNPGDPGRLGRVSLVHEDGERRFRMAHLAIVGSHRVNGVARLHTDLLRGGVFRDFAQMWPERFVSITNGITPRRWLLACNPRLASAISTRIGDRWTRDLECLRDLLPYADDPGFQDEFLAIKRANKIDLAKLVQALCGVAIDPDSLYDVQVKRMHEYKRQLLNAMHIIALYQRAKADPHADLTPRTFIFGAKAAPAYRMAKLVIRLINGIAEVVNADSTVADKLKVVFLPDYRVTIASVVIPAADLSEQISTAGMEASGTGNMKLALNGALTIGTLDGANIEIKDAVGEENIFIFGHTAEEVAQLRQPGRNHPWERYRVDPELAGVIDALRDGTFAGQDAGTLREIWSALMQHGDRFMHLADFRSYADAQARAGRLFRDRRTWAGKAIRNVACMGYFSSDRAIREYAREIWNLHPVPPAG